jgi:MFS family permease
LSLSKRELAPSAREPREPGARFFQVDAPAAQQYTDIPHRLDRLRWSGFHSRVVAALGITWILDGLEVTLAGSLASALADPEALGLTPGGVGLSASSYLVGAVVGALGFGYLTDRLGRKKLFSVTLGLYLVATALTGASWDLASFCLFRFLTGAGIGGEYAAINSAIQELIPARYRGRTDLAINGSFWVGAATGAGLSVVLLDRDLFGADTGWRLAFLVGAVIGLVVLWLRRYLPESPRWLMIHGRVREAAAITADIELRAKPHPDAPATAMLSLRRSVRATLPVVAATLIRNYSQRTILCTVLMASQAFLYNAVFFTYGLILTHFYGIEAAQVGWYILPFAAGNFLGPLLLGPLFDSWGRKPCITATYAVSGLLLAATGYLFFIDALSAEAQTAAWTVIFFFASAAASAAYLTIGEVFPLEIRANAIAIFYAFGTALGGVAGPLVFGELIESGAKESILVGYLVCAALMLIAAVLEAVIGVRAERRSLETVAAPLSSL